MTAEPEAFYISRRLTREIVEERTASALSVDLDPAKLADLLADAVGIGPLPLSIASVRDTVYALANAATRLVAGETRAMDEPLGEAVPTYITARLTLEHRVLQAWGGIVNRDGIYSEDNRIAGFRADGQLGVGRVIVALFGSVTNLIGYVGETPTPAGWRNPSDANGLFEILDAAFEPEDPDVEPHYLRRELRFEPLNRMLDALEFWETAHSREYEPRRFDVLIKVFHCVSDVELEVNADGRWQTPADPQRVATLLVRPKPPLHRARYARLVLGTPIWLRAAPPPSPDELAAQLAALPTSAPSAPPTARQQGLRHALRRLRGRDRL